MKKFFFTGLFLLLTIYLFSQNELDALRFSEVYWSGTARTMAMGGSFSALGTDLSVSAINPAGLAYKNKSEIIFTTNFGINKAISNFAQTQKQDFNYRFNFNTWGVVLAGDNTSWGFAYNRTNDYSMAATIEGVNNKGSMIEYFTNTAQGNSPNNLDPFSTSLAYNTYLIDLEDTNSTNYTNPFRAYYSDNVPFGETQKKVIYQKGGMGEIDFFGSFKVKNLIAFGATIGLLNGSYTHKSEYSEYNFPDSIELSKFTYSVYNKVNINGFNVKIGMLLTPIKNIRISAAVHSPNFISLTDYYQTSLSSHWLTPDSEGNFDYSANSENNIFDYKVYSPWRAVSGLGIIIGKFLSLDAEYEYVDYTMMKMHSDDYLFETENENITKNFRAIANYRGGAELRIGMLYFRGGYAFYDTPFKDKTLHNPRIIYSGGFGFRNEDFFLDIAFTKMQISEEYNLYDGYKDEPVPQLYINNSHLMISLGILL